MPPAAQSPSPRTVIRLDPGPVRRGARQTRSGMLSSLAIGRVCSRKHTPLYSLTPRPRVPQESQLFVISTTLSQALVSPTFPRRKWISSTSTLPKSYQLPRPPLRHTPEPAEVVLRDEHIRTMKGPVVGTDSPYPDPSVKGPSSQLLSNRLSSAASNSKNHTGPVFRAQKCPL